MPTVRVPTGLSQRADVETCERAAGVIREIHLNALAQSLHFLAAQVRARHVHGFWPVWQR
jgi:hypothetical protein